MKRFLASERERYQRTTNSIVHWQVSRTLWADREKRYPHDEEYKYERMDSELSLAQQRAEFDLHMPLWVHLGFLPEDNVPKQDKRLQYTDLLSMFVRIGDEMEKKDREIWNAADPNLRAWITARKSKKRVIAERDDGLTDEA